MAASRMAPMYKLTFRRLAAGALALALLGAIGAGTTAVVMYRELPDIGQLLDYRPKQPLRIFTSDGVEIGEFGAERRYHLPMAHTPRLIQDAVLAIEDDGFRTHPGISIRGVLRAALANLWQGSRSQGGSTITQQVARTFYLSSRKSYTRKVREMLLAIKIEQHLSKDQILELYMNQIFLGQRAYGFEAASHIYFGKPLTLLSVAETAMLAGLPQNPVYANPVVNFERARKRQMLVLERMHATGAITRDQWAAARDEPLHVRRDDDAPVRAEHAAEMVRRTVHAQYGDAAYTRGLKVYTTLRAGDQQAAHHAVRRNLLAFDRGQPYRGPEGEAPMPAQASPDDAAAATHLLSQWQDDDELRLALVTDAPAGALTAVLATGETVQVSGDALSRLQAMGAAARATLKRGSVIRVTATGDTWTLSQWPQADAALVAMEPATGRLRALVGGFDIGRSPLNHASQSDRAFGPSFEPFIYSAVLEHGVMPETLIHHALPPPATPAPLLAWSTEPPLEPVHAATLREVMGLSSHSAPARLAEWLGADAIKQWAERFGFDPAQLPDNLTIAEGAAHGTPLQLARAYATLAAGGKRVAPALIERITDAQGAVLFERAADEPQRVIPERNAFVTRSLMNEAARNGPAVLTQLALDRRDLYVQPRVSQDGTDVWFAGFQPELAAIAWVGQDAPGAPRANRAPGSLPAMAMWIDFMRRALAHVPPAEPEAPPGVLAVNGQWRYSEWAQGGHVEQVALPAALPASLPTPPRTPP